MPDTITNLEKIPSSTLVMIDRFLPELTPQELKTLAQSNPVTRREIPEPSLQQLQVEDRQQKIIRQQQQRLQQHQTRQIVEQQQVQMQINQAMAALQQAAASVSQAANQANQAGAGAAANIASMMQRVNQVLSTANPRAKTAARTMAPALEKMFSSFKKTVEANQQLKILTSQQPSPQSPAFQNMLAQNPAFQNRLAQNSALLEKSMQTLKPLVDNFVERRKEEMEAAAVMKKAFEESSLLAPRLTVEGKVIETEVEKDLQVIEKEVKSVMDNAENKPIAKETEQEAEKTIEHHLPKTDEGIVHKLKELEEEIEGKKPLTPFSTTPSRE